MSWTNTIPIWDGRGWTGTLDDCRSARGGCRRGALAGMPSSRARFTRQRLRRLRSPRRSRPRAPCTWPQTGGGPSPRRSRPPPAGATRRSSPSRTRAQPVPVFSAITVSRERALARNSGQSKCAGTGRGGGRRRRRRRELGSCRFHLSCSGQWGLRTLCEPACTRGSCGSCGAPRP